MITINIFVIKELVDVILVLAILIQLFKITRGTKGFYVMNGVLILFLALSGSLIINLPLLSILLTIILLSLMVALPILFQNELKRALEKLGRRNPIVKWFIKPSPIATASIDVVAEAADSLADEKIGALIVFEREDPLSVVHESGSYLDAVLTKIMIEQIFYPKSPLHDGAVLINGNRIQAAGCFLPLNNELSLPQKLGSRHRAGLSLATQTDAIVIIVSEETGRISLAHNGVLESGYTSERIKYRLRELIQTPGGEKNPPAETAKPAKREEKG